MAQVQKTDSGLHSELAQPTKDTRVQTEVWVFFDGEQLIPFPPGTLVEEALHELNYRTHMDGLGLNQDGVRVPLCSYLERGCEYIYVLTPLQQLEYDTVKAAAREAEAKADIAVYRLNRLKAANAAFDKETALPPSSRSGSSARIVTFAEVSDITGASTGDKTVDR